MKNKKNKVYGLEKILSLIKKYKIAESKFKKNKIEEVELEKEIHNFIITLFTEEEPLNYFADKILLTKDIKNFFSEKLQKIILIFQDLIEKIEKKLNNLNNFYTEEEILDAKKIFDFLNQKIILLKNNLNNEEKNKDSFKNWVDLLNFWKEKENKINLFLNLEESQKKYELIMNEALYTFHFDDLMYITGNEFIGIYSKRKNKNLFILLACLVPITIVVLMFFKFYQ